MNLADLRASAAAVVTITDVAALLDVDERTVSRALDLGQLPCLQVGRRRLIPREQLLALLSPTTTAAGPIPGPAAESAVSAAPATHDDTGGRRDAQSKAATAA